MSSFPLPILPLPNLVFFPHTTIPMLIVEPSYIKMIKDCLITDQSIGISMADPLDSTGRTSTRYTPQRIATMGKPILLEEKDDGSLKILIRGERRIELLKVEQNIPYLVYRVKELPDSKDQGHLSFASGQIERLKTILFYWIDDTVEDSLERESFLQSLESLHHIVDYLSMFMVQDHHMRQILLENQSLHERVQILSSLLRGDYPDCEDELVLSALKEFEFSESYDKVVH